MYFRHDLGLNFTLAVPFMFVAILFVPKEGLHDLVGMRRQQRWRGMGTTLSPRIRCIVRCHISQAYDL